MDLGSFKPRSISLEVTTDGGPINSSNIVNCRSDSNNNSSQQITIRTPFAPFSGQEISCLVTDRHKVLAKIDNEGKPYLRIHGYGPYAGNASIYSGVTNCGSSNIYNTDTGWIQTGMLNCNHLGWGLIRLNLTTTGIDAFFCYDGRSAYEGLNPCATVVSENHALSFNGHTGRCIAQWNFN